MPTLEQQIRDQVRQGVEEALAPYLSRIARPERGTYSIVEAAQVIGVSDRTVSKLIKAGRLPTVEHLGSTVRISVQAVDEFINGRQMSGPSPLGGVAAVPDIDEHEQQAS